MTDPKNDQREPQTAAGAGAIAPDPDDPNKLVVVNTSEALSPGGTERPDGDGTD